MMNFKNAAYLAEEDGIQVDYVKVDDDIAVEDSLYTVGRRGVAGTVFVHKVAGADAEEGMSLSEVKAVAQKAIDHTKSIGFAFTSCTVPAKGTPTFQLAEDEMEYDVGIHGEPGIRRERVVSADELAKRMVTAILEQLQVAPHSGQEVALLINGFGATPLQEVYVLNHAVVREIVAAGHTVDKVFVGNFMTSIDMGGASVSIMKLDDQLKGLLHAECDTLALFVQGASEPVSFTEVVNTPERNQTVSYVCETREDAATVTNDTLSLHNMIYLVDKMSEVIIKNEVPFCELDSHAGDGESG